MKKKRLCMVLLLALAMFTINVKEVRADSLTGFNKGSTSIGGGSGTGTLSPDYVGLKVSVYYSSSKSTVSYVVTNQLNNNLFYFQDFRPKYLQDNSGSWEKGCSGKCYLSNTLKNLNLNWEQGFNFDDILKKNDFKNLKAILKELGFNSLKSEDYIIVEPMMKLENHYGTAYELVNSFIANTSLTCSGGSYKGFHNCYAATFYGASYKSAVSQSVMYNTIRVNTNVTINNKTIYATNCGETDYTCRKNAITSSTGGGSIGVYKYSSIVGTYKFSIYKQNRGGKPLANISFNIYNSAGKLIDTLKTKSNGYTDEIDLAAGETFEIREVDTGIYKVVNTSVVMNSNHIGFTITNKTPCEDDFDNLSNLSSMTERVKLYQKYKSKGYNNLLNLNIKDATTACSHKNCSTAIVTNCLTSDASPDKSNYKTDLSCYNDVVKVGGVEAGYCISNFSLTNHIGKTSFTSFSGQMLYVNKTDKVVLGGLGRGILSYCYVMDRYKNSNSFTTNYVAGVHLKYKTYDAIADATKTFTYTRKDIRSTSGNYMEFFTPVTYEFKPLYLSLGNGKIFNESGQMRRFIGYGIPSYLNDKTDKGKLEFSVWYNYITHTNKDSSLPYKTTATCDYKVKKQVVECDPNDENCDDDNPSDEGNENVNIVFRTISTTNPFPGKSGTGREVGANWCDGSVCTVKNNSIIKKYITDRNDSYNSKKESAKYIIDLDESTIKKIREYNKTHSYDDFETLENCDENGNGCKSKFLRGEILQGHITIRE